MFGPFLKSFNLLESSEKKTLASIVGARVLLQLLDVVALAGVALIGAAISARISGDPSVEALGYSLILDSRGTLVLLMLSVVAIFVAKTVFGAILLRKSINFLAKVEADYSMKLFKDQFGGGLHRLRETKESELLWVAVHSSQIAFGNVLLAGTNLLAESALAVYIFVAFLIVDFGTAVSVTLFFLVLLGVFQITISRKLRSIGSRLSEAALLTNTTILDFSRGFREIEIHGASDFYLNEFNKSRSLQASLRGSQQLMMGMPRFVVEAALMVGVVTLVGWQYVYGSLEQGLAIVGVFIVGGFRMMAAFLPIQNALAELRSSGPIAERAQSLIRSATERQTKDPALLEMSSVQELKSRNGGLELTVENVSFSYLSSEGRTLSKVSLNATAGEFIALVGPSGSGKSTLFDLMLGLLRPDSGSIRIENIEPQALRTAFPGAIGYVPQRPTLLTGSVAKNISLESEMRFIDYDRVEHCLELVGLHEFFAQLPEGVNTLLGSGFKSLSGGQLQRIGIARALYSNPRLLFLDEVTSALDPKSESAIVKLIEKLRRHATIVAIAHRVTTVSEADCVFVLEKGRIVSAGSFSELRRDYPPIRSYFAQG